MRKYISSQMDGLLRLNELLHDNCQQFTMCNFFYTKRIKRRSFNDHIDIPIKIQTPRYY